MILKDKIKKIPDLPGVYRFIDKYGNILYIGRATSLKKRVSQYFRKNIDPRIGEMVGLAKDIKFQKTDNVLDAIVLEANLIKKHWPKYNIVDRDDRSFVYIVINKSDYPKPIIIRGKDLKKISQKRAKVFGPYFNATMIKRALRVIRRIFPYSTCKASQGKPCFDRQVGLCPGICVDEISKVNYNNNIKNIILLLGGNKKRLIEKLKKENPEQVSALKHLQDATLITNDEIEFSGAVSRIEGYDISHLSGLETYGSMVVFSNGQPDNSQYRLFQIKTAERGDDMRALAEMIERRFNHPEWPWPDLIMIDGGTPQISTVIKVLNTMNIAVPLVGISKYGNDRLVFSKGTPKAIRDLAKNIKGELLKVREEAHRFGLRASRNKRRKRK
jgi:excinuclease ABC subunit C